MTDKETIGVYDAQAADYAKLVEQEGVDKNLVVFLERLPAGGHVLDWGCGAGNSSAFMIARGFAVTATDASPEFARLVSEAQGITVREETFAELNDEAAYDGVWASFSLLHDTRAAMPERLAQARHALKPGGRLFVALKSGTGAQRDEIGRFYTFYEDDEIKGLVRDAGFTLTDVGHGEALGLDGKMWPYITLHAHA